VCHSAIAYRTPVVGRERIHLGTIRVRELLWDPLEEYGGVIMEIILEKQDAISVFKLNGRLDSNTSQGFEEKIFGAITDGSKQMVIDFKDIDYISSAGLRVILKATKALNREKGKIMLCSMQDYVKEVFEIAGFDAFLPIVKNREEALKSF